MHCSSRPKVMDHGGTSGDRPRRVTISRPNLSVVTSGRVASILHGLQPTETSVPKIAVHPLVYVSFFVNRCLIGTMMLAVHHKFLIFMT